MVTFNPAGRILVALFDLSQTTETIDLFSLSEGAGLNLYRTLAELDELARRGLVDAGRLRLTLSGVAVAASLDRRSRLQGAGQRAAQGSGGGSVVQLVARPDREQSKCTVDQGFTRELVA